MFHIKTLYSPPHRTPILTVCVPHRAKDCTYSHIVDRMFLQFSEWWILECIWGLACKLFWACESNQSTAGLILISHLSSSHLCMHARTFHFPFCILCVYPCPQLFCLDRRLELISVRKSVAITDLFLHWQRELYVPQPYWRCERTQTYHCAFRLL